MGKKEKYLLALKGTSGIPYSRKHAFEKNISAHSGMDSGELLSAMA
jgi:hypothetical protein